PITWSTVYSALTNETSETSISAADESLLRVLLGLTGASSDAVLLFSRPGALAEIEVTKDVTADNGVTIDVDDLILELVYDFSRRSSPVHDLKVEVNDGLMPLITTSEIDLNGRSDGRGIFERSYQGTKVVSLQAPARYGVWKFSGWESANASASGGVATILSSDPVLNVTVATDVAVRAVFTTQDEPSAGSFRR